MNIVLSEVSPKADEVEGPLLLKNATIVTMSIVKKLTFVLPFTLSLIGFIFYLNYFLRNPSNIFSFDLVILWQIIYLSVAILLTALCFVVFAALANTWWLVIPLATATSFSTLLIIPNSLIALVVGSGLAFSFIISYTQISKKMSAYLNFSPTALLHSPAKQLATLILLVASLAFYLAADLDIKQHGFKLPDSILDTSLNIATSQMGSPGQTAAPTQALPSLTPQQIQLLKQNPDLLRQYGLDPTMLDQIANQPTSQPVSATALVKPMIQQQIDKFIKPYQYWIPGVLAVFFFLTIVSLISITSFFSWIFLWLIFWILEKTGFIKFEVEMREVKKLVV